MNYDLDSNLVIATEQRTLEIDYIINIISNYVELLGQVGVTSKFDLTSMIEYINRIKNNEINSEIVIPHSIDINGLISVNERNTMQVQYVISAIQLMLDLYSQININNTLDLESFIDYIEPVKTDLESNLYLPYKLELSTNVHINEWNRMFIQYNQLRPPVHIFKKYTIHDTYIESLRPTLNHGLDLSMLLGTTESGIYQSIFQINIGDYFDIEDIALMKAELIFDTFGNINGNYIVDAFKINSSWDETQVTWQSFYNDIIVDPIPVFSFTMNSDPVKVNIIDYVIQLHNNNIDILNILLKPRNSNIDLFNISTKEVIDINLRPRLEFNYIEDNWYSYIDAKELLSSITVKQKRNKDLLSMLSPRVKKSNDLESGVLAGAWQDSNLSSEVSAEAPQIELLSLVTAVFKKDLNSEVIIEWLRAEIDSYVQVKRYDNLDLFSEILLDYIKIDLGSSINVRQQESTDLLNLANIELLKLELESLIDYIEPVKKDLISESKISITIDLNSLLNIKPNTELENFMAVTYPYDIESTIEIIPNTNLLSDTSVKVTTYTDLDGNVSTFISTDAISALLVSDWANLNLSGLIEIQQKGNLDLSNEVIISHTNDLDGMIVILKNTSLLGNICVNAIKDLLGSIEITPTSDIIGNTIARLKSANELLCDATIRQFNINEINSKFFLIGSFTTNLLGNTVVRQINRIFLDGIVNIQTTARRWVPNVHAEDIFKYNKKLPRYWKREEFIP